MEHGSTSSPLTPKAFPEPSASSDPPEPEHPENIEQPSSPLPPEPFPEPSPSPEPQELEPSHQQVLELHGHQQKLTNWTNP